MLKPPYNWVGVKIMEVFIYQKCPQLHVRISKKNHPLGFWTHCLYLKCTARHAMGEPAHFEVPWAELFGPILKTL